MSTIRAAALDAAIVEALRVQPGIGLDLLSAVLMTNDMERYPPRPHQMKREARYRLQVLQSAGRIEQSSRGRWQIVGGAQ